MSEGMAMGEDSCHSSVVMATYNGERFLLEQLESLMVQEVLPDEIVVADDCSTDGSFEIVREFASAHQEIKWAVYSNDRNLGWKRNFKGAIARAHGEYVFLCDQDDVWLPSHVADLERCMDENTDLDVITSAVELLVEEGSFVEQCAGLEKALGGTGLISHISCDKSYLNVAWPGCTYCVRRSFVKEIFPFWKDDFPHDAILYCAACIRGTLGHYDAPTLRFRRHSSNASDERSTSNADRRELVTYYRKMNASLLAFYNSLGFEDRKRVFDSGAIDMVEEVDAFEAARLAALEKATPANIAKLVAKSGMYATRRAFLADLACILFPGHEWKR